jgi:hypothetical protein
MDYIYHGRLIVDVSTLSVDLKDSPLWEKLGSITYSDQRLILRFHGELLLHELSLLYDIVKKYIRPIDPIAHLVIPDPPDRPAVPFPEDGWC